MKIWQEFKTAAIAGIIAFAAYSVPLDYDKITTQDTVVIAKSAGATKGGQSFILALEFPNGTTKDVDVSLATYSRFNVGSTFVKNMRGHDRGESMFLSIIKFLVMVFSLATFVMATGCVVLNLLPDDDDE